jgi:hypothetical protein
VVVVVARLLVQSIKVAVVVLVEFYKPQFI